MRFTDPRPLLAIFLCAFVLQLAGCGGAEKKEEEEPVALSPEQQRIMELIRLGPDPYEAKAPVVTPEAKAEFDMAMKVLQAGDEVAAEVQLKTVMEKYPELSGAAYNLAVLEKKRGNLQASKDYLKIAISRNGNNLNARNLLALIYRDEGNFADAEKEYLEIIKIWGGYLTAYKNIGILYDLYMGRFEEALPYYKKYNSLVPQPDKQVSGWIIDIERRLVSQPPSGQSQGGQ